MSLLDDILGPQSKKERKREQIRRNRRKGKAAEDQVRHELEMEGYEVERTQSGADFTARKHSVWTGELVEEKQVEVKTGNSTLTERQKKEKRNSENYEVRRRNPLFY